MKANTIEELEAAVALMAERMQPLFESINAALEQVGQTVGAWAEAYFGTLKDFLQQFYESLYLDEPMPGEEPVDYVLRVGARSGFFIYPDEAWRYRANLDWWNERKH